MKICKIILEGMLVCMITFIQVENSMSSTIIVKDTIYSNTTWSADTVKVTGNIVLYYGPTLTINPGTHVIFQGYYSIEALYSPVRAIGAPGDSIIFTVKDTSGFSNKSTASGAWGGIKLTEAALDSTIFKYCKFQYYKSTGSGACLRISSNNKVQITNSHFTNLSGNSLFIFESNAQVKECTFDYNFDNNFFSEKSTIWSDAANPYLFRNIFSNNLNSKEINYFSSGGVIEENTFFQNNGAINLGYSSNPTVQNNKICNNKNSGIIITNGSRPTIISNLLANNYGTDGGAISISQSSPAIINNTITNNASVHGGGIFSSVNSHPHVFNTILWGNTASSDGSQICLDDIHSSPDFFNSLIQGGMAGFGYTNGAIFSGAFQSNIDADPEFVKASLGAGLGYNGLVAFWNIKNTSDCLNTGIIDIPGITFPQTDLGGNTRIANAKIDMGGYETRIGTINPPCGIINSNTEWIADTVLINCDLTLNDGYTLTINPGTVIQFQGYYKLDIKGTLLAIGKAGKNILFTINDTTGFYNELSTSGGWHGIRFNNSTGGMDDNDTSVIDYCKFEFAKSIADSGGAMYVNSFNRLKIDHSLFCNNMARYEGGAIFCNFSNFNINNTKFYKNEIKYHQSSNGSAISCISSNLNLNGVWVVNNTGPNPVYINGSEFTVFVNSIIANNNGGGIWNLNSNVTMLNCDIVNNYTSYTSFSSSSYTVLNSTATFINSILRGNYHLSTLLQIGVNDNISNVSLINCNIEGGYKYYFNTYLNNIDTIPVFANPTQGAGNQYDALSKDWSLLSVSHCINSGTTNAGLLTIPGKDISGNPRINGGYIDMGALENQSSKVQFYKQPIGGILCEGNSITLTVAVSDTSFFQWKKDGQDIPGATSPVYHINALREYLHQGSYVCVASNAYGDVFSNSVFIQVRKNPIITEQPEGGLISLDETYRLDARADGDAPLSYRWYKDGISLPDDTLFRLQIDSFKLENEGNYFCQVSNVCSIVTSKTVTLSLAPQICMVTAKDSTANIVVFEKGSNVSYTKFNVYREGITLGYYEKLNSVLSNSPGVYVDNVDPREQAYLYKITGVKTNNTETDLNLCNTHKTMHLRVSKGVPSGYQLDWDEYIGFPYSTYYIYRSTDGGVSFDSIHAMSSSTRSYTDYSAPAGYLLYYIAVIKTNGCYPGGRTKAGSDIYSQSVSNLEDNRIRSSGISTIEDNVMNFSCYPNPYNDFTTISYNVQNTSNVALEIYNAMGEKLTTLVDMKQSAGTYKYNLCANDIKLSTGVFFMRLKIGNSISTKKLVKI